jgi:DNA adenine methylase
MKYMGSKNRIAKYILPIILKDRKPGQWYVEPFVGGGNMIDKVDGNRIGADIHEHLIKALILIRDEPTAIPDLITETNYQNAKDKMAIDGLTGFIGFSMSFGGKWFGGYRRDVAGTTGCVENMKIQTRRSKQNAIKQSPKLQGVEFYNCGYQDLEIPPDSIIYCDPPYAGTTSYANSFNHPAFWEWCREKTKEGHTVFVSEYSAPDDFECVWQMEIVSSLTKNTGAKTGVEKLFRYKRV